jgi:hypothetical protein
MRKLAITLFLLAGSTAFLSCTKDSSPDIRDIFVATYSVTETWTENSKTLTKPAYSMSVEKSSQEAGKVLLNNFADYGAGITAEATISGNNLTIPQQTLSNLKAISGTGSLSGSTLSFAYTESYGSISISISASAIKR